MAMILHAFVGRYVSKLSEFIEEEMSMLLGVKDELLKLLRRMERISGFLESAERKRHADPNINAWVRELKDIMYDADDIIDLCMIDGRKLLEDHTSKSALPPLGLLPQLKFLRIRAAAAIKTIGPEFLGPRASAAAGTAFPKLEELEFYKMDNWEEWSFGMVEGVGEERRGALKLLPRLKKLLLGGCPKLRALPEGLWHVTSLQELGIYDANNLIEIDNLPSLKTLRIYNCPRLEHVENLDRLQYLDTATSGTDADGETEHLPQWLLELLQNAPAALQNLKRFTLTCSVPLLKTFLKDGPNWPIIQRIPHVSIYSGKLDTFGRSQSYIEYTKDPPAFKTNVVESEESVDG
ncbi:uncharacterized protein LOC103718688 isoform X2 [Phoenix dactylifera]|uniref:Uncharacterized protein LOC103718688 isoform X2 n=1 Tax=Phoenix dactylifera TaxID=42345 RepID=A0A8B8JAR9_PHODC|nr:uncharacterized protein LOC103718688 isoform X2 [Phoenix dactylifera]